MSDSVVYHRLHDVEGEIYVVKGTIHETDSSRQLCVLLTTPDDTEFSNCFGAFTVASIDTEVDDINAIISNAVSERLGPEQV